MKAKKISTAFLIVGLVMTAVAVAFLIYAFGHPEGSWKSLSLRAIHFIYALYIVIDIGCFVASIVFRVIGKQKIRKAGASKKQ
jgi:hypothetical protein